jgi:hypothetical protein
MFLVVDGPGRRGVANLSHRRANPTKCHGPPATAPDDQHLRSPGTGSASSSASGESSCGVDLAKLSVYGGADYCRVLGGSKP